MENRRRRVRRGTRSCWECKRKKIKCTFSTSADSICNGCKRRGSQCISQEFPEGPGSNRRQLGDRLHLVEELVGQLIKDTNHPDLRGAFSTTVSVEIPTPSPEGIAETQSLDTGSNVSRLQSFATASEHLENVHHGLSNLSCTWSTLVRDTVDARRDSRAGDRHSKISRALLEAWPNKDDRDLILSGGIGCSSFFSGVTCIPYSSLVSYKRPTPEDILREPSPESHPVMIARKLIMVGAYLQGIPPTKVQELATNLSIPYNDIMHRAVETAVRLVTSNDDLVGSVEFIECILIESMFQNSAGNLRRAYLSMRRALVLAQMIGLDKAKSSNSPLLKFIDPETKVRIDPQQMWFRLLQSDRYLSLMLGLPQGTEDKRFASVKALEGRTALERMERMNCSAAGRILQRNSADMQNLDMTQEIDQLLQSAAALMPPKWWLAPDIHLRTVDDADTIQDTIRLINQFTHFHLLGRLHLPYLLHTSTDPKYDYSKITAIIASRELLSRFIPFRGSQTVGSFCRGLDFLAFTASTALCLAHINAHHQKPTGALLSFLSHQRLADRGMLEQILENMTDSARTRNDMTSTKIASIIRHLLTIEADAAIGGSYTTNSSYNADEEELAYNGKISDGGAVLKIYIPYVGTVKIERHGISKSPLPGLGTPTPTPNFESLGSEISSNVHGRPQRIVENPSMDFLQLVFGPDAFTPPDSQYSGPGVEFSNEWDLQGVDLAFFDSVFRYCSDG